MKWQDRAVQLRETHSWTETYKAIRKEYPNLELTDGQIRDAVRWRTRNKGTKVGEEERIPKIQDKGDYYIVTSGKRSIEVTKDKLKQIKLLYCDDDPLTINELCRKLNIPRRDFFLIKTAFGITHDDVPYIDEELTDDNIDNLVDETLERRKEKYFLKLQQKEIEVLKAEVKKYRQQDYFIDKIHKLVTEHFQNWQYDGPTIPLRPKVKSNLMLEVPIVDLHLAKLAWEPETGENYDSKIAEKRFMEVIYDVVERSKGIEFEQIVFPIGNDFFNFDDTEGGTRKGTMQDNDSRWWKMYLKGNELLIKAIDILSQLAPVKVFQIPGNHDFQVSFYAIVNLASYFRHDENIIVDTNPKTRKYIEFGKCLIGYTHGDKEKKRIFGNMQVEAPEAWGRTLYREWHTGHLHSEQVKEEHGVKVRSLSSVTATDSWHSESGYVGAIATSQSFVWDKQRGLRDIWYTTVR